MVILGTTLVIWFIYVCSECSCCDLPWFGFESCLHCEFGRPHPEHDNIDGGNDNIDGGNENIDGGNDNIVGGNDNN